MATLNSTYVNIQPTIEKGFVYEAKLHKVLEEYIKSEKKKLKLVEEAKVTG